MTSQPAAGALFTVVLGELCYFSVATFQQKLEKYAEGGDGGLTRATMRVVCGLPAEDVALHPDGASHGSPLVQARAWWRPWRRGRHLVPCVSREALPGERLGHHVSRLRQEVWPRVPARDRVGTLLQLKARGWWKELPPRGRSGSPLIPRILEECEVLDLFPPVPDGAEPVAQRETLSADPCVSWCECVALIRHLVKLQGACDAKANHRGRGVMNAMDVVEKKNEPRKSRKDRSHLAWMTPCATRSRLSKRTTCPTSSCRRAGRRSRTSCVTSMRSVSSVASIRHRSGHMCCLLPQRISTAVQAARKMDLPFWLPLRELSSWSDYADHTTAIGAKTIRALVEGVGRVGF